jgi:hypothetical protein
MAIFADYNQYISAYICGAFFRMPKFDPTGKLIIESGKTVFLRRNVEQALLSFSILLNWPQCLASEEPARSRTCTVDSSQDQ